MNDNKTEAVMYQDENCDYKIAIGPEYLGNWDYVFAVHSSRSSPITCTRNANAILRRSSTDNGRPAISIVDLKF